MSTSGISSNSLFSYDSQSVQNKWQQVRQDFQQLGQDLQSGNLSAAQQDLVTLQQLHSEGNSTSTSQTQSQNPVQQDFSQLAQDLQSGNLSAAQQDYTKIQQDLQSQGAQAHHHHHHSGGDGSSQISQLFQQLGQDIQSGNLSSAQQTFATLQQDLQQLGVGTEQTATPASGSSTVSVTA